MTTPENPWRDILPPSAASVVSARRVDSNLPWDFFWAKAADRRVLLTLRHKKESSPKATLPTLRNIEINISPPDLSGVQILAIKLMDMGQQDIFHTLCLDIVEASREASNEPEAVALALNRTWRWHHLLRRGTGGLLTSEEQKGLMGELLVFERILLRNLSPLDALECWRGPSGAPKDFEIGRVAIEVKARRAGATPHVAISSESQLDATSVDALFLCVVDIDEAPMDAPGGVTIADVAGRLREEVISLDPGAADLFDERLVEAGMQPEDDYSSYKWIEGPQRIYRVNEKFPRISLGDLRSGVSNVRYSLSLSDCEAFATEEGDVAESLSSIGGSHAH